jgi:predicted metalloprotease with PDZ domain
MRCRFLRRTTLALMFVSLTAPGVAAADPLQYELSFERPNTHLMDVMISANGLKGPNAEFAMPDWAPGAYHIENYAAQVQVFSAIGPEGQRLPWFKTDSQTWRIELGRATSLTVRYQIYGNTLANNQAQYNDRHAFIGGPAVWMYLVNGKDRPIRLTIDLPQGWQVATGLERLADNSFAAADYDSFADSPIEISDFIESTFQVQGTTYHFVVHDVEGRKDFAKFEADTEKIVEAILPFFAASNEPKAAPFSDYWFLFHIWPGAVGGLEHLNSTQINFSKDWDNADVDPEFLTQYDLKLFVTAHEFFHAWNVKRLRPKPLGPFDYSQMAHTPSLWISEGLTDYYAVLALVRAGLISPEDYLEILSRLLTKFEAEPGRTERSIAETSWDTWFSDLRTDNNLANTTYSYYEGGWIIGHLLDFEIRQDTRNQKSLDDWMRLLYERYALPKPGFTPEDAVKAASEVAGTDLSEFFHRYITGKEALPYQTYFGYAGVDVQVLSDPNRPFLGVSVERNEDGRARLRNILPGSPAETAGLDRGDIILGVDSKAVDEDGFLHAVGGHKPGDMLRITLLRQGELKDLPVPLIASPYSTYVLKPMEHLNELQRKIYRSWMGLK